MSLATPFGPFTLRHELQPGDWETIVHLHGDLYAREYGFDATFASYVAGPLAEFAARAKVRERLWIAERDTQIVGCIAVVEALDQEAQLRWYMVEPSSRGLGLGKRLLAEAVAFARGCGYPSMFLWTVSALKAAAHLYRGAGFHLVESTRVQLWGVEVVEEKYHLDLGA